jgi:molybdate transport system substrate-binding protein
MSKLRVSRWAGIVVVLLIIGTVACGGSGEGGDATATIATDSSPITNAGSPATGSGMSGNLTVFAAASLTEAFTEMQADLEAANPGLTISWNFAGSQALVTQLTQGASADVFASANTAQMQTAQDGGVIDGDPVIFARNRLAIIIPRDNPADIQQPADLANDGVKLVIANEDVPVGGYTHTMLDKMSADAQFGSDFRSRVESNVVSEENNVKQVVTKVQLGEADAGVVYVTDISKDVRDDVTIIDVPDQFNVIAEYPIAAVRGGDSANAQAFIDYLLSDAGQAVLAEYGFSR